MSIVNNDNFSADYDSIISKLCNISSIHYSDSEIEQSISFRVNSNIYSIPFHKELDVNEEIIKINNDLNYQKGFLNSKKNKKSNTNNHKVNTK